MKPFKAGAKMVADKFALKVQPVVLIATAWHFSNKRKDFRPGSVTAIYLEPFVADKNDPEWLNNLHNTMQKVYDDELANHPRYR
jgi:1-acyl-sn-glycerol-3-phosphate acyltransferase